MKTQSEKIGMQGRYTICQWRPGAVGGLLKKGFSLNRARWIAEQDRALLGIDQVNNIIVTDGLNLISQRLIGVGVADLTWHAIGTGPTAAFPSDHVLATEVKRLAFASRSVTINITTLSVFYWAAEATFYIRELGTFGGAATSTPGSGTLFSRALYGYDNSAGLVDLTFDYEITLINP